MNSIASQMIHCYGTRSLTFVEASCEETKKTIGSWGEGIGEQYDFEKTESPWSSFISTPVPNPSHGVLAPSNSQWTAYLLNDVVGGDSVELGECRKVMSYKICGPFDSTTLNWLDRRNVR